MSSLKLFFWMWTTLGGSFSAFLIPLWFFISFIWWDWSFHADIWAVILRSGWAFAFVIAAFITVYVEQITGGQP